MKPVAHELTSPAWVELPNYAVFDVTGSEAQSFLQGQFCNDLAEATTQHAQLSGYCNPKGRLLALFTLFAIDDGYRLVLHADLLESMSKRLQIFVMRADVKIAVREDLLCSGIILPRAGTGVVDGVDLPALPAVMDVQTTEHGNWVRTSEVQILFVANAEAQQSLSNASTGSRSLDKVEATAWRLQNILAGVPSLFSATVEQFVPQMVNLQQAGGLSFTKGCYPGQEIVARMQYLGKLKRQMLRFTLDGSEAPVAGAPITTGDGTDAGVVVDAVATDSGVQLLAVMKLSTVDGPLMVAGQQLIKQALPYEL